VDTSIARPTACRPEKGRENTHPVPGLVRPRIAIAAHGFVIDASWVPPIPVNHVKASLVGIGLARRLELSPRWSAGVRAHAVLGSLHGPITCDDDALADPASICYQGTRSDDRWRPGVFGIDATVGAARGRLRPYAGAGYTLLRPRFRVNFTDALGSTDNREVIVDLRRIALFGGVTWTFAASSITAEAYSTPLDAVTARVVMRTALTR
jgi:hypothetical protein